MNKDEFLQRLNQALMGEVPQSGISENIFYYNGYITDEVKKGRTEQEVLEEIGDPRLIAKTIIDATPESGEENTDHRTTASHDGYQQGESRQSKQIHQVNLSKWYWKLLMIVVLVLVVATVFSIVGGILSLVIPILGPIIMVLAIMWFIKGFRR